MVIGARKSARSAVVRFATIRTAVHMTASANVTRGSMANGARCSSNLPSANTRTLPNATPSATMTSAAFATARVLWGRNRPGPSVASRRTARVCLTTEYVIRSAQRKSVSSTGAIANRRSRCSDVRLKTTARSRTMTASATRDATGPSARGMD